MDLARAVSAVAAAGGAVAALAAGGQVVDDADAPRWWTLSDRSGNRVCIVAWPDGAA